MDLSIDKALKRLSDKEMIHTFRNPCGILLGAGWPRDELIKAIEIYGGAELTGEEASSMNHGMAIEYKDDWLFIETVDNDINQNSIDIKQKDGE